MPAITQPWYMRTLARMDQKARCICSAEMLTQVGENLKCSKLSEEEKIIILTELDRMLSKHSGSYEQSAIAYLRVLMDQLKQRSWYEVALAHIAICARNAAPMQTLLEFGEDLKFSEMEEFERGLIIAELDRMLNKDSGEYKQGAISYLDMLRHQIAGKS